MSSTTPTATAAPASGDRRHEGHSLVELLPFIWPPGEAGLKVRVVMAMTCLLAAKLVNVTVPFFYKAAVDALSIQGAAIVALPLAAILAYGAARVGAQGFGELRDAIFAKVAQSAIRRIALKIFRHLHGLSLRFHLERQTGGLTRVIERGTKGTEFVLRFMLFNIMPTFVEIALVCGLLYMGYGAVFAAITFCTIIGYTIYTLTITEWRTQFRREMNKRDNEASTRAVDSLLNYETVKYFGNEEHEARRFDRSLERYERAAVQSQVTLSLLNIGQGFIIAIGLVSVMGFAAAGVRDGTMTVGDFVLVNTFLIQLYLPLNFLGFAYREIKQGMVDMEKMWEMLGIPAEIRDRPGARTLKVERGEIVFDNVEFGYDDRRPILRGVSFTVPAGKTVAIVGPSGAGKSTISRILFRFYDVNKGRVLVDGQDIRDVTQVSLRAAMGMVPQDTVLFNDTIRYNVGYGRPAATQEEIEEAVRLAHIDGFIARLPDGYKTMVGERGLKLSGGEKQRVAIARTILKGPPILLFDEATSALDSQTEQEIQQNLREVSANRTTLVIAHRLSTVVDADEILVLDQGHIVERGRHRELVAKAGLYADMWARQQEAAAQQARLSASDKDLDLAPAGS
jgi:ATP-binding cassette, subfamily B, heavy metal transporter